MKHNIMIYLFLLFGCSQTLATGPSWLKTEITPISVNSNGDILCRTRYEQNPSGAYTMMPVEYGLAVISHKNIFEYVIHTDELSEIATNGDQPFTECETKNRSDIEMRLRKHYHFTACNTEKYQNNIHIPLQEFEKKYKVDINNMSLFGLKNAQGHLSNQAILSNKKIDILYDFGKVLLVKVINGTEENDHHNIWDFHYKTGINIQIDSGTQGDVGFDMQQITGVVFIN